MKSIKEYIINEHFVNCKNEQEMNITEKLTINSKTKINKNEPLEVDEIEGPETPGKDYFDEDVVIIGWPFKDKNDPNYKKTKEYIKKEGYSVYNDLEEIEDQDMWDYFCYAYVN